MSDCTTYLNNFLFLGNINSIYDVFLPLTIDSCKRHFNFHNKVSLFCERKYPGSYCEQFSQELCTSLNKMKTNNPLSMKPNTTHRPWVLAQHQLQQDGADLSKGNNKL